MLKLPPIRSIPEDTPGLDPSFVFGFTAMQDGWYMSLTAYHEHGEFCASLKVGRVAKKISPTVELTWIEVPWVFVYFAYVHILSLTPNTWELDWDMSCTSLYETIYFRTVTP